MIVAKTQYFSGQDVNLSGFPSTIEGINYHFYCSDGSDETCGSSCHVGLYGIPSELCGSLKSLAAVNTQYDIYSDCGGGMMADVDCDTWADPVCGGLMMIYAFEERKGGEPF